MTAWFYRLNWHTNGEHSCRRRCRVSQNLRAPRAMLMSGETVGSHYKFLRLLPVFMTLSLWAFSM